MKHLAIDYARTESQIQKVLGPHCVDTCSVCSSICCKAEICHESQDSAWLRFVRKTVAPDLRFSTARGWLTRKGCRLPAGRPPVCYAYFCDAILGTVTDHAQRYALLVAGQAINTFGRRAVGNDHLVLIEDLERLTPPRVERLTVRLKRIRLAVDAASRTLAGKPATATDLDLFKRVCRPPTGCTPETETLSL